MKTIIYSTCWEYVQGKRKLPCCSACPACDCHKEICKNCRFGIIIDSPNKMFYDHDGYGKNGKMIPIKEIQCQRLARWEIVSNEHFCGEFKGR